jgi:hypothetical protein
MVQRTVYRPRKRIDRITYYARPGPASTGLAVHGFLDPNCRITVEVLASRRS